MLVLLRENPYSLTCASRFINRAIIHEDRKTFYFESPLVFGFMGHSCDGRTQLSLTLKPEKAAHCRRDRQSGARRTPTRIPCWEQSARRFHDEDLPALPGSAR